MYENLQSLLDNIYLISSIYLDVYSSTSSSLDRFIFLALGLIRDTPAGYCLCVCPAVAVVASPAAGFGRIGSDWPLVFEGAAEEFEVGLLIGRTFPERCD